jgi:hypothetical protein
MMEIKCCNSDQQAVLKVNRTLMTEPTLPCPAVFTLPLYLLILDTSLLCTWPLSSITAGCPGKPGAALLLDSFSSLRLSCASSAVINPTLLLFLGEKESFFNNNNNNKKSSFFGPFS